MSDYGLDDRAIGIRSPAGAKDFSSLLCVQTGSGAHPASCTMGTGGPFPGGKARPGRDADHSPPPRSWMSRSYISSPPKRLQGVERDCFAQVQFTFWPQRWAVAVLYLGNVAPVWLACPLNVVTPETPGVVNSLIICKHTGRTSRKTFFISDIYWFNAV
jgi:hypothetical protein